MRLNIWPRAHIHEAPVWIVPCLEVGTPTRTSGSSIYPAVQNMLLAARALGLGATLTTLYLQFEEEAEATLGSRPASIPMPCCRSATRWVGLGRTYLYGYLNQVQSSRRLERASPDPSMT
jgi:nitroreductase